MDKTPKNNLNDLGPTIVFLRMRKNLKQKELAEQAGITPRYLSSIETKKCVPSMTVLCNLADVLEIPVSRLLQEEA